MANDALHFTGLDETELQVDRAVRSNHRSKHVFGGSGLRPSACLFIIIRLIDYSFPVRVLYWFIHLK